MRGNEDAGSEEIQRKKRGRNRGNTGMRRRG